MKQARIAAGVIIAPTLNMTATTFSLELGKPAVRDKSFLSRRSVPLALRSMAGDVLVLRRLGIVGWRRTCQRCLPHEIRSAAYFDAQLDFGDARYAPQLAKHTHLDQPPSPAAQPMNPRVAAKMDRGRGPAIKRELRLPRRLTRSSTNRPYCWIWAALGISMPRQATLA